MEDRLYVRPSLVYCRVYGETGEEYAPVVDPGDPVTAPDDRTLQVDRMQAFGRHFVEAAANELTIGRLDPTTRVPEFKFCAAAVRKAD